MKQQFIIKENTGRLILIFAGWSTDPSFYSHIRVEGWDLMVVWDYTDLSFSEDFLDPYHTVIVFAWSMGVYAASRVLPFDRVTLSVAVNGTEYPVDNEKGIPPEIFYGTAETLDSRNLIKFRKRMAGAKFNELKEKNMPDDIEGLRNELNAIGKSSAENSSKNNRCFWDKVFISSDDRIFPPAAQKKAWTEHPSGPEIIEITAPHYVDLGPIVKAVIPAKDKVKERFRSAFDSYENQAKAQRLIADKLVKLAAKQTSARQLGKIAEIGPGTGLLTHLFAATFFSSQATFVELYPVPPYSVSAEEIYVTGDAEEWAEIEANRNPGSYDAIVSASAIQWFANPERFIRNIAKLLKPSGFIAVSSFRPGNLSELRSINPFGLHYKTTQEWKEIVGKYFEVGNFKEDDIKMVFDSPRDALRHLRHTGVGGSAKTELPLRELLSKLPSHLTYRPLFITASRPRKTSGINTTEIHPKKT